VRQTITGKRYIDTLFERGGDRGGIKILKAKEDYSWTRGGP